MSLTLVIGGTRSGKSAHAERLALASARPVRYVATADGNDPSMAARVAAHAARRPADWETVEAGDELGALVAGHDGCVLIDGLGAWIAGVLHRAGAFEDPGAVIDASARVRTEIERLADAAPRAEVIVVAEDAGSGVLPPDAISRTWLDLLGEATQRLVQEAARADLVVAGRAIALTGPGPVPGELRHHGDRDARGAEHDHAVNVLAGGPPAWLRTALDTALDDAAAAYPDERPAVAALAALHDRDPAEVVPTNGASEALWLLGPALRPRLAACVHPAFTEAEAGLHAHGVPVVRVARDPKHDFALDPAAVPEAADMVVVGNPASPSGTLAPTAAVLALRRPGRIVVVDEAFMSLVPGEPGSLVSERLDDVVVVRSLTKSLAVPGLRVGYALAGERVAARLRAVRPPWSANALALAALVAAAAHPDELAAAAENATAERMDLAERLAAIDGVRVWPSAANFCLVEVANGPGVVARLREEGIAVRPAASFPGLGTGHLRITAREGEANARVAAALAEAVA